MNKQEILERVEKLTNIAILWYCQMQYFDRKYERNEPLDKEIEKAKDKELLKALEELLK